MKRLLQGASVVLVVLGSVLAWRVVQVLQVSPPVFEDPPQIASASSLPPALRNPSPRGAARDSIVKGNLFETERGYRDIQPDADAETDQPPLPPPTNVVLNGVFVSRDKPMAILTDSSSGNRQLTLHVGDNVGDYQLGEITERRVTLIGRGDQEFLLELDIKKGAAAPARPAAARGARPAQAHTPTAAERAQAARQRAAAARARAQTARTQTPAQRAAAARARAQANKAGSAPGVDRVDPTQARLEALKRLREAAAKR